MAKKVRDSLVRTILDQIFQGKLNAGERLPSIEELGRSQQMSVVSVREAIQKLSLMGLVHVRQGGGTFLDKHIPTMIEILDARKYVEMATCLLAARNATEEENGELDEIVSGMRDDFLRDDSAPFTEKDLAFHLAIGRMSRNVLLTAFLVNIQDLLYYLQQRTHMLQGTLEDANRYHPLIASAIRKREGNAAQVLMAEHIEAVKRAWGAYDRNKESKARQAASRQPGPGRTNPKRRVKDP
ncbi:MAG: FadR family transcriptional regulator [Deltaproteobacteria bacterium]|nr:FadR family transcriptional regulator [Deltaproteobacteria bacterium]